MHPGLNSATLSLNPDTVTVQSDASSGKGAKGPISQPMVKQMNAMSAREKHEKVQQPARPSFHARSLSSNSESIVDDNVQEGTAANYPIQKTEVKVSVVSRKRTYTCEHVLPAQPNSANQVTQLSSLSLMQLNKSSQHPDGEEHASIQSSSHVLSSKADVRPKNKTKQIVSL